MKARFDTKLPALKDATPAEMAISEFVQRHAREALTLFNNGLTFSDNMNARVIEVDLAHGVLTPRDNPTKDQARPRHIFATAVVEDTADSESFVAAPIPSLSWFMMPDGKIGLKALYPLPETFMEVQATGSQTLGTGYTVVNYSATPVRNVGGGFTYNSTAGVSTITAAAAGLFDVRGFLPFNTGAASAHNIKIEASGTVLAISELQSQTYYTAVVSRNYYAAAGTAFRMLGACAGGTRGTYSPYPWLSVRQLERDASYSRTVRLVVVGS